MKWIWSIPFVVMGFSVYLYLFTGHTQAAIYTCGIALLLMIILIIFIVLLIRAGFGKEDDHDYR